MVNFMMRGRIVDGATGGSPKRSGSWLPWGPSTKEESFHGEVATMITVQSWSDGRAELDDVDGCTHSPSGELPRRSWSEWPEDALETPGSSQPIFEWMTGGGCSTMAVQSSPCNARMLGPGLRLCGGSHFDFRPNPGEWSSFSRSRRKSRVSLCG